MSEVFNSQLIKNTIADFLPNEVLFALGEYSRVECASLWIKKLQTENESLKAQLKREMACTDFYADRDNYDFHSKHERSRIVERDMEDNVFDDLNNERLKDVRVGGKLARKTVKAREI